MKIELYKNILKKVKNKPDIKLHGNLVGKMNGYHLFLALRTYGMFQRKEMKL